MKPYLLPVVCALVLGACASNPPLAEVAAAKTMVSEAQTLASRYAPNELGAAQAKLARAEAALARYDYDLARGLAREAEVDAKLAWSIADSERSRQAVADGNKSLEQLKQQMERRPQ